MSTPNADPEVYRAIAENAARESGVDPDLVMKVIQQESAGDPHAVSAKGAAGLMQIMPANYSDLGISDPFDVTQNVKGGTKFLKTLIDKYHGDTRLALIDYNGGPAAVAAYQAGKPFKESAGYVKNILGDPTRPDPFSLDDFVKAHGAAATPSSQPAFNLDEFVKNTPEPGLWDKVKSAASETLAPAVDLAKGIGEGAVNTGLDLVKMARAANPTGMFNNIPDAAMAKAEDLAKPVNTTQKVGKGIEQVGEFAIPGMAADELVLKGASKVLPDVIANPVLRVLANGGELAARGAAQAPIAAGIAKVRGEDPVAAAKTAAVFGSVVPGITEGAAPALGGLAMSAARSALKTPVTILRNSSSALGHTMSAKLDAVARTVLENRLGSPEAAEAFIHDLERELDKPIDAATALGVVTDAPQRAQKYLQTAKQQLNGVVSNPAGRSNAFQDQADALINEPGGSHAEDVLHFNTTQQASPILNAQGNPVLTTVQTPVVTRDLRTDMTPRETLNSARGADTKWDPTSTNAQMQAKKVTEIAERDALKEAVPAVVPILNKQAHAIVAKNALQREAVRHGNMDLISLGMAAGHGNPIALGHQVLRMSGVKGAIGMQALSEALASNNVRLVTSLLTKMGYGEYLAKPEGVSNGQIPQ